MGNVCLNVKTGKRETRITDQGFWIVVGNAMTCCRKVRRAPHPSPRIRDRLCIPLPGGVAGRVRQRKSHCDRGRIAHVVV
jgi:hypothetical protein